MQYLFFNMGPGKFYFCDQDFKMGIFSYCVNSQGIDSTEVRFVRSVCDNCQ